MMMAMFNMSSMHYAQVRITDKQAHDGMNVIQEPDEKMNIMQCILRNMSELQPFPFVPLNMNKNEHGEWMTDSVIPSELFNVKIPSVLTGFMRTVLDNQVMSLTNIMNQVYDDNDAFIRTVLYEFMKG